MPFQTEYRNEQEKARLDLLGWNVLQASITKNSLRAVPSCPLGVFCVNMFSNSSSDQRLGWLLHVKYSVPLHSDIFSMRVTEVDKCSLV